VFNVQQYLVQLWTPATQLGWGIQVRYSPCRPSPQNNMTNTVTFSYRSLHFRCGPHDGPAGAGFAKPQQRGGEESTEGDEKAVECT
jgi:hypothetical protein